VSHFPKKSREFKHFPKKSREFKSTNFIYCYVDLWRDQRQSSLPSRVMTVAATLSQKIADEVGPCLGCVVRRGEQHAAA
jgi:hypothetical protein